MPFFSRFAAFCVSVFWHTLRITHQHRSCGLSPLLNQKPSGWARKGLCQAQEGDPSIPMSPTPTPPFARLAGITWVPTKRRGDWAIQERLGNVPLAFGSQGHLSPMWMGVIALPIPSPVRTRADWPNLVWCNLTPFLPKPKFCIFTKLGSGCHNNNNNNSSLKNCPLNFYWQ